MDSFIVTDSFVVETAWRRWSIRPVKSGNEFHSECPQCGGEDRFIVFPNGRFWCRNLCGASGWLDDDQPAGKISPELAKKRLEQKQEELNRRKEQTQEWIAGFNAGSMWMKWHDEMTEANRAWWHHEGIGDDLIDFFELGYIPKKKVMYENQLLEFPAYTLPARSPADWQIVNIHYRLAGELPKKLGKYRSEQDIYPAAFYTLPGGIDGEAIVVEGAKKAINVYNFLERSIQVIGVPSCFVAPNIIEQLEKFEPLWVALDPGVKRADERLKKCLPRARMMALPGKPDDLILSGMSRKEFLWQQRAARI